MRVKPFERSSVKRVTGSDIHEYSRLIEEALQDIEIIQIIVSHRYFP